MISNQFNCDSKHIKEFICNQCNILLCSKCLNNHNKKYGKEHDVDHVDDIQQSLKSLKLNNSNYNTNDCSSEDNNNDFKISSNITERVSNLWNEIRISTKEHDELVETERNIASHFNSLHNHLMIEEQRFSAPIKHQINKKTSKIENNFEELKKLVYILNLTNIDSDDEDNNQDGADTFEKYSFEYLVNSVKSSNSLQSFIGSNKNHLFNDLNNNNFKNIKDILESYNNNLNLMILHSIQKYNDFKLSSYNNNNQTQNIIFELETKDFNFDEFNKILNQSIYLISHSNVSPTILLDDCTHISSTNPTNSTTLTTSTTSTNSKTSTTPTTSTTSTTPSPSTAQLNSGTYIFSAHKGNGATLINTSDWTVAREIKFVGYDFQGTYSSMVTVGSDIYCFGGDNNSKKYLKYSVVSNTFVVESFSNINPSSWISACYNGQDHIYLVSDEDYKCLDLFNIRESKFEKTKIELSGNFIISVFFRRLLFSVSMDSNELVIFDPKKKTIEKKVISNSYSANKIAACTDGLGNIYIHSDDNRFYSINLDLRDYKVNQLKPFGTIRSISLYPLVINLELNGAKVFYFRNYYYKNGDWIQFSQSDRLDRNGCPSTIVRI